MNTNIVAHVRHHMGGLTWNLLFLTLWMEDCDVFKETAKKTLFNTPTKNVFYFYISCAPFVLFLLSETREEIYNKQWENKIENS